MNIDPATADQIWLNLFYRPQMLSIPSGSTTEQEANRQALYRGRRRVIDQDAGKKVLLNFEVGRGAEFSVTLTPSHVTGGTTIDKLAQLGLELVTPLEGVTMPQPEEQEVEGVNEALGFNPDLVGVDPDAEPASIADIIYGTKPDENKG